MLISVLISDELTFCVQGEGFMVGVQINPVKGLPSGFPVKNPLPSFSQHMIFFFEVNTCTALASYICGIYCLCRNCSNLFLIMLRTSQQNHFLRSVILNPCFFHLN